MNSPYLVDGRVAIQCFLDIIGNAVQLPNKMLLLQATDVLKHFTEGKKVILIKLSKLCSCLIFCFVVLDDWFPVI